MSGLFWQSTGWRREFWWASAAGASLALAVLSALVTYGVYVVRAEVDSSRYPQLQEGEVRPGTTGLRLGYDDAPSVGQFSVVTLYPQGSTAPLPPGLPADLVVGDVVLSPGVAALPVSEGIQARYGPVAGMISPAGLGSPDELLVYVIAKDPPEGTLVATSFGTEPISPWAVGTSSALYGESMVISPLVQALPGVIGLLAVPAVGLALVCARRRADVRGRRDLVLAALGAPPSVRLGVRAGAAVPGAALGVGVVGALFYLGFEREPNVPFVNFTVSREALDPGVAAVGLAAAVATVTLMTSVRGRIRPADARPSFNAREIPSYWIVVAPLVVAAAIWLPDRLAGRDGALFSFLSWGLALASIPALALGLGGAIVRVGQLLGQRGRGGRPVALVAGSALASAGRQTVLTGLVVFALIGVAFQAAQWSLLPQEGSTDGRFLAQRIGGGVASVEANSPSAVREIEESVSASQELIAVTPDGLVGSCEALRVLDFNCDSGLAQGQRAAAVSQALSLPDDAIADVGAPNPSGGLYLVVSMDEAAVDVPALKALAYRANGEVGPVGAVTREWVVASEGMLHEGRWVVVWSTAGLSLGLISLVLISYASCARLSYRLAPSLALFGPRRLHAATVVALTAGLPVAIAGAVGVAAHTAEAASLLGRIGRPGALNSLAAAMLLATVVAACAITGAGVWRVSRDAATWLPGRQDM